MKNIIVTRANELSDVFNDAVKVSTSHVPAVNTPARINVPKGGIQNIVASEFVAY